MSIDVVCIQCGTTNQVNERLAGRRVRCPQCDTVTPVPELDVEDMDEVSDRREIRSRSSSSPEIMEAAVEEVSEQFAEDAEFEQEFEPVAVVAEPVPSPVQFSPVQSSPVPSSSGPTPDVRPS